MSRWRKRKPAALPKPPSGVRAELHDGKVLPLECRYEGLVQELHTWIAAVPVPLASVETFTATVIPARTQLLFKEQF